VSGLVGWIDLDRDLRHEGDVVRSMTETMAKRGPAGGGTWIEAHAALGYRYSSLPGASAERPMVVETGGGSVAAVLAGRITNAAALRSDIGGVFKTSWDLETLLAAYLRWGDACAERIDGAFAFAIWEDRTRRLLLGRDRMGVKPLYYHAYPNGILFASEPKGIMSNRLYEARLDFSALPLLLQPRLSLPGETPLVGLREVPPAHVVTFGSRGVSARRYWRLVSEPHTESFADTARHVRSLLEDAVGNNLDAGAPLGAMLSGGLDSTSVAAIAIELLDERAPSSTLETFCVQLESDRAFMPTELRPEQDGPYAVEAAKHIGSRHQTLTTSMRHLEDALPATRQARDLPAWGQFDASMYVLFREMRRSCVVAFTGEAADEIFGGYPYFFKPELLDRATFPWLGSAPRLSDYLAPDVTKEVNPRADERARYDRLIADVPQLPGEPPPAKRMREIFYLGMSGPLSVILDRKDRMSAAVGLDVRVPFCDHHLVQYVWNVPWSMKAQGGVKGLLKAATADLLPPSTLNREKTAYPHVQSAAHDLALLDEASRIINDPGSAFAELFDRPRLTGLITELRAAQTGARTTYSFPGGASPAYMLINLIETAHWTSSYRVAIR
jgi:asparagine synthase (glutamine-hydrolysing)/putative beta-lactam synthetase